jgi:hypothetical protein
MRMRMFRFTAGPIRIERGPNGRLHVGWVRSVREVGGMAGMAYGTSRDGGGPRRTLLVFALSGALAGIAERLRQQCGLQSREVAADQGVEARFRQDRLFL